MKGRIVIDIDETDEELSIDIDVNITGLDPLQSLSVACSVCESLGLNRETLYLLPLAWDAKEKAKKEKTRIDMGAIRRGVTEAQAESRPEDTQNRK